MFLLCWAGWDHTGAVGRRVACIRADDGGDATIVSTEEERDGMNNEGGQDDGGREGGRRGKKGQLVPRLVLVKDD